MINEQLYKVTGPNGESQHGGHGTWGLPSGKRSGKWWKVEGDIEPCLNGLHLCRKKDLLEWLGPVIWEAEHKGELIDAGDKVVVRQARLIRKVGNWNNQTAQLYAADCAEQTLKLANDKRCDEAVRVSRLYAFNLAGNAELDAAWAAAKAAAKAAVGDAARDAAWAATWTAAGDVARDAAWAAAWAAAGDAARDAAWHAAWDAEREWQLNRLTEYLTGEVDLEELRKRVEIDLDQPHTYTYYFNTRV